MDIVDLNTVSSVQKKLHQPQLQEVAQVLQDGLKSNFSEVNVEVVDCPDLTKQPFTLTCPGLGGSPQLIDLGGPPYLLPLVTREKVYSVVDLCKLTNLDPVYIIGAGAGPWPFLNCNCEGIINFSLKNGQVDQQTRIANVDPIGADHGVGKCKLQILPKNEVRCSLLANFFSCQGLKDQVLRVHCKVRSGKDDFITSIRKTLQSKYGNTPVGLGGTFLLKEGKGKYHVMPDFSKTPLNTDADVDNWLHFFNMSAPIVNVGTLISHDPDLDLRVQHFHGFSYHGEGGHYHIDTTPDTVEYLGYFKIAEAINRIDAPIVTHKIGRD